MAVLTSSEFPVLAEEPSTVHADFKAALAEHHCGPLLREETRTLQINVGKLCNQACQPRQLNLRATCLQ